MKRILNLYKMLNKNNQADDGKGASNKIVYIIIGVVIAIGLGLVGYKFADMIEMAGGVPIMLNVGGLATGIIIVGFGLFMLINSMYMSSDIELLITMPFSAFEIVVLRLISFIGMAYGFGAVLMLPINIGYTVVKGFNALEWIGILLMFILLPLFVTLVIATLVILIMSLVKVFRNMDVLRYIGIIVLFILICVYFYLSGDNSSGAEVEQVVLNVASISQTLQYVVPIDGFLVAFITTQSILSLLEAVGATALAFVIFYLVARGLYLNGALNMQNTKVGGKLLHDEDLKKMCKKKDQLKALISKEFKMVRRNPVYALYNFIIGFLWPILAIVLFRGFGSFISKGEAIRQAATDQTYVSIQFTVIETAVLVLMIMILPILNSSIAYSSLSREGNSFPIMKQIPVPYETQIKAKIGIAERILQFSTTFYVLIISIIINLIMEIPVYFAIIPVVVSFLVSELCVLVDMIAGYKRAYVNWDDEKSISRKNDNVGIFVFEFFGGLIIPGIMVIGVFFAGNDGSIILLLLPLIAVTVVLAVLVVVLRKVAIKKGERRIRTLRF